MKIAICTPHYGDVTADFAISLARMVAATVQVEVNFNGKTVRPEVEIFFRTSSLLPDLRSALVKQAMDWGANFLLWADADHSFPSRALIRLLSLNLPVVGANYPRRRPPYHPTAVGLDHEMVWTSEADADSESVIQVLALGLGFCLIDRTVFETLTDHAQASGEESMWPLFAIEMGSDGTTVAGEDVFFFNKLLLAGVPVYLDHVVSWTIGHVHQRVLTNADAGRSGILPSGGPITHSASRS